MKSSDTGGDLRCVIPSRTDAFLRLLFESMDRSEPGSVARCIVGDNGLSAALRVSWPQATYVDIPRPFVFAAAVNACAKVAMDSVAGCHLLVLNDDTEVLSPFWATRLATVLEHPRVAEFGLLSPMITGGVGNPEQGYRTIEGDAIVESRGVICFVGAAIRHSAWLDVGPLDERFTGYGYDDDDYCMRLWRNGWLTGVTNTLHVKHGRDGRAHTSTYMRDYGASQWKHMFEANGRIYFDKWNGAGRPRRCLRIGRLRDEGARSEDLWVSLDPVAARSLRNGAIELFDYVTVDLASIAGGDDELCVVLDAVEAALKPHGTASVFVADELLTRVLTHLVGDDATRAPTLSWSIGTGLDSDGQVVNEIGLQRRNRSEQPAIMLELRSDAGGG